MIKSEAYKIVFEDLTREDGCSLFRGIYDAENGNASYMHGVSFVIGYIARQISMETYSDFSDMFFANMVESENECE